MSERQTHRHLPREVDVLKLTQQEIELVGPVASVELPRLRELVQGVSGSDDSKQDVQVELKFSIDEGKHRVVKGSLQVDLDLVCQRCLETMRVSVSCSPSLAFVWSDEQAKHLPSELEPVLVDKDNGLVNLYEMVEDELLLSVPISPVHTECESGDKGDTKQFGEIQEPVLDKDDHPFSALKDVAIGKDKA